MNQRARPIRLPQIVKSKTTIRIECGHFRVSYFTKLAPGSDCLQTLVIPGLGESYLAFQTFLEQLAKGTESLGFFAVESVKFTSVKAAELRPLWQTRGSLGSRYIKIKRKVQKTLLEANDQAIRLLTCDPLEIEAELLVRHLLANGIRRIEQMVGHSTGALRALALIEMLNREGYPIKIDRLLLIHPGGLNQELTKWGLTLNYFWHHALQRRKLTLDEGAKKRQWRSLMETRKILFKGLPSFIFGLKLAKRLALRRIKEPLESLLNRGVIQQLTILHSPADQIFQAEDFTPPDHPRSQLIEAEGMSHGQFLLTPKEINQYLQHLEGANRLDW
ncbi:MAG: hypothetical protein A2508_01930 [Candidatus Lambdaproteobacteria bacterium RIFOXYD12_FULL_49_8]|uniref:Uncharacterized protein n=1 Tax=Candidatus Lambdaproteobacteria bacterium RIFOXYD2_FULL_50_16 TaxID=1817772 RepID=A0A1F6G9B1_9PROT|nr:MAG: hypothetical protein A2527_05735 [Candidatus Lambdaproteobacteria bacterium RIFOXYD2_FULL_50_16]OGG98189.1 MAG: hypothetical protein A2508_01930 [Candidatus Lambdaproteobacteria bacterium RIFOXYD12_FULL_49_8]